MISPDDFVKQYPYGSDYAAPELPPLSEMHGFVPEHYAQAVVNDLVIELAQMYGCSDADVANIRKMLYEPELVLVSIDDDEEEA